MGLAGRHPEKIERLIILNSSAFSMSWFPLRLSLFKIPWLNDRLVRDFNLYLNMFLNLSSQRNMPSIVKKGFKFPYQTREDRIAILRFIQDVPFDPEHISFEALLEIEHGDYGCFAKYPYA